MEHHIFEEELITAVVSTLTINSWNEAHCILTYTIGGSLGWRLVYIDSEGQHEYFLKASQFGPKTKGISKYFQDTQNDVSIRFNKVEFIIYPDGQYESHYWWDDEEVKKDKLAWSQVLPQWLNDRLLSVIYQAGYDDKINWQRGEFTFTIQQGKLNFDGVIYDGQTPVPLVIRLPNFVVEGVLEHYQLTNEGVLKDEWQPWNQLIIRSPNNSLDLDKDVTYRLVADKV